MPNSPNINDEKEKASEKGKSFWQKVFSFLTVVDKFAWAGIRWSPLSMLQGALFVSLLGYAVYVQISYNDYVESVSVRESGKELPMLLSRCTFLSNGDVLSSISRSFAKHVADELYRYNDSGSYSVVEESLNQLIYNAPILEFDEVSNPICQFQFTEDFSLVTVATTDSQPIWYHLERVDIEISLNIQALAPMIRTALLSAYDNNRYDLNIFKDPLFLVENLQSQLYRGEGAALFSVKTVAEGAWKKDRILIGILAAFGTMILLRALPYIGGGSQKEEGALPQDIILGDPLSLFMYDLRTSQRKANELYTRSSLMLVFGLAVAIGGIFAFILSIDPLDINTLAVGNDPDNVLKTWQIYLLNSIRPTFMLIFIESIAWFLLRQYRVSLADYKEFYHLYLQRMNYLIAWRSLEAASEEKKESNLLIATALLEDQKSGRLKPGETTESLEQQKVSAGDRGVIEGLLKMMMEKMK